MAEENKGESGVPAGSGAPPAGTIKWFIAKITSEDLWSIIWRTGTLILLALAAIFLGNLLYNSKPNSDLFKDSSYMRSLITVLLAVGILVFMAIVLMALLFLPKTDETIKRVGIAREILTPLLGILGTIIGFYFGSQSTEAPKPPSTVPVTTQTTTPATTPTETKPTMPK